MHSHSNAQPVKQSLPLIGRARGAHVQKVDVPCAARSANEDELKAIVGGVVERVRVLSGLSLKEFAAAIQKDESQIKRWIAGPDRPQFDAIWGVAMLRVYLVIAFAELARPEGAIVETTISIKRTA